MFPPLTMSRPQDPYLVLKNVTVTYIPNWKRMLLRGHLWWFKVSFMGRIRSGLRRILYQRREIDDLVIAHKINPSHILAVELKDKYEALNSLVVVFEEKPLKSNHVKNGDKSRKDSSIGDQPILLSHEI
jgi:hypothetical protein